MKNLHLLKFAPITVLRSQFVDAGLQFRGMDYHVSQTVAVKQNGRWVGRCNCFGLLFLAARECGLLHPDLPMDLPPMMFFDSADAVEEPSLLVSKVLLEIVRINFDTVPFGAMLPSDLLLMRYRDVDPTRAEPHHVGMCVGVEPLRILHASQSTGKVYDCDLNELFAKRINEGDDRVLRCRNFVN